MTQLPSKVAKPSLPSIAHDHDHIIQFSWHRMMVQSTPWVKTMNIGEHAAAAAAAAASVILSLKAYV